MALNLDAQTEFSGTWIFSIKNFSQNYSEGQHLLLLSPSFSLDKDNWHLKIIQTGLIKKGRYLSITCHCRTPEKLGKNEICWTISIISKNSMSVLHEKSGTGSLNSESNIDIRDYIKMSDLWEQKELYLPDDVLTISCKITKSFDTFNKKRLIFNVPESQHVDNLESILRKLDVGDVITLRVSNKGSRSEDSKIKEENVADEIVKKDFLIYKGILTSQSSVFQKIFEDEDIKENLIEIDNMDPDVCEEIINFLHTDKLPLSNENILDLLVAADKYQLLRLKALCEEAIFKTLSPENSLNIVAVSHSHNAQQLKKETINYIVENLSEIIQLKDYELFKQTHLHLAYEIFENYFLKTKKNAVE